MPALGQQEPADLRDVRTGGDVDVVVLLLRLERIAGEEVMQGGVDPFEFPRICQVGVVALHADARRSLYQILADHARQLAVAALIQQQLDAVRQEILMHAQ
ncbi:hypothetical protein D3C75_746920 [compost metagenome]